MNPDVLFAAFLTLFIAGCFLAVYKLASAIVELALDVIFA